MSAFSAIVTENFFFAVATTSFTSNAIDQGGAHCSGIARSLCAALPGCCAYAGGQRGVARGERRARARADRRGRGRRRVELAELAAPAPPAGSTATHAEQVPRHRSQRRAACELARDVALERRRAPSASVAGVPAEQSRIEPSDEPRILVGRAADHDAVDVRELRHAVVERHEAAVDHDAQRRKLALQAMHAAVVERRNLAVLLRAQAALSQALRACTMNVVQPAAATSRDEIAHELVGIVVDRRRAAS